MLKLTKQQKVALYAPTYFGFDTMHPKFAKMVLVHSEILTVQAGYEVPLMGFDGPVWHGSTASSALDFPALRTRAEALLKGVGVPGTDAVEEHLDGKRRYYHIRRKCTPEEAHVVGPVKDLRGTQEQIDRIKVIAFATGIDPNDLLV